MVETWDASILPLLENLTPDEVYVVECVVIGLNSQRRTFHFTSRVFNEGRRKNGQYVN
jgi:hypothetical protein